MNRSPVSRSRHAPPAVTVTWLSAKPSALQPPQLAIPHDLHAIARDEQRGRAPGRETPVTIMAACASPTSLVASTALCSYPGSWPVCSRLAIELAPVEALSIDATPPAPCNPHSAAVVP